MTRTRRSDRRTEGAGNTAGKIIVKMAGELCQLLAWAAPSPFSPVNEVTSSPRSAARSASSRRALLGLHVRRRQTSAWQAYDDGRARTGVLAEASAAPVSPTATGHLR